MAQDRFDKLEEPRGLPADVRSALPDLQRFEHLEIGELPRPASPAPISPASASAGPGRILCKHCGQSNEIQRDTCWACFAKLREAAPPPPPQETITVALDGQIYRSTDRDLPEDIGVLIDRIRKEGYSQQLLVEWRNWRAPRNVERPHERPLDDLKPVDAEAFRGNRVSVIRLDGKVYKSDDPNLTPEMKRLLDYVDQHGVTPELMDQLRKYGDKVKWRPHTTADPTDGDISFWNDIVRKLF